MRKVLVLFAVILILAIPVLADTSQKAKIDGGNIVAIRVNQMAWNYGPGNINQDVGVRVTGNHQIIEQDSLIAIADPDDTNVNNTMKGINLIKVDLNQYGNNTGSGNIEQGINVLVDNNYQTLDQDVVVAIA